MTIGEKDWDLGSLYESFDKIILTLKKSVREARIIENFSWIGLVAAFAEGQLC